MWTHESLHDLIQTKLANYQLIVVANREPYIHRKVGKRVECIFPASGMATGLDPILRASGGIWVGHGSGDADRKTVDANDHVRVPPDRPCYTLRRVWLTKAQEEGYYFGLANEGLWPLCHVAFTRPTFSQAHWEMYKQVNALFADAVLQEAGSNPTFVFVQDYHFALLPRMLKQANPNLIVAHFWHIPWPNRETFRVFPWKEELLDGMLGNDLLGFHLRYHCDNFLETVDRTLESRIDYERVEITRGGKTTAIRPFPISIDYASHTTEAASENVEKLMEDWRSELDWRDHIVGIGIDRIDYTKGIPERLRAVQRFLEKYPDFREKLVFVQIGVPSRSHIPQYKAIDDEIDKLVDQINWRFGEKNWRPIHFFKRHFSQPEMMALHRLATFCIVSSLHDGLNLVSKEFVSSRIDDDGVLILSAFTGAAREFTDALLVNPFDIEEMADAIYRAIEMPQPERQKRMKKMRAIVEENNIYRWAGKILSALLRFDFSEGPESAGNVG